MTGPTEPTRAPLPTAREGPARTGPATRTLGPPDRADGEAGMASPSTGTEDPSPEELSRAAAVFALLASPVRLHVLWLLARGEHNVTSLAERVGQSLPAVSQHLTKLRLAGLVDARRVGRHTVYLANDPAVGVVVERAIGHLTEGRERPRPAVRAR